MARLVVVSGPRAGMEFPLFFGVNQLGAGRRATVLLSRGKGVRRQHARIAISGDRAVFELTGKSKAWINGWPAGESRLLSSGSIVRIGNEQLYFEAKPPTKVGTDGVTAPAAVEFYT